MLYINQIIATVCNDFPTSLCKYMKFGISYYQHLAAALISGTMSTFQTDAGNIILTSSKLHFRSIRHTLSEIRTKRLFSYQGIAIKRNYKGQKALVEANGKHGFDLESTHFHNYLSILFYGDIEGITYFPSGRDRSIWMVGALPISPLTMTQASLQRLNLTPCSV